MTDRRPKLLRDALMAAAAAESFVADVSLDQDRSDLMRRSAVERQMEVLSEACARLLKVEEALGERVPELRFAIGLRNRVIHGHDSVDDELVGTGR